MNQLRFWIEYKGLKIYPSEFSPLVIEKRTQWYLKNSDFYDEKVAEHGINYANAKLVVKMTAKVYNEAT